MNKQILMLYGKFVPFLPIPVRRALRSVYGRFSLQDVECKETVNALVDSYQHAGVFSKGDLVFDIGANIGLYADAFDRLGARVVSVEPVPSCLQTMQKKFSKRPGITLVPKGIGDSEREMDFFVSGNTVASTFSEKFKGQEEKNYKTDYTHKIKVQMTTIDALIAAHGMPAYCKLDVEGFEKQALSGLTKKIPCLSFETHSGTPDETDACLAYLEKLGYSQFACDRHEGEAFFLDEWGSKVAALEKSKQQEFGNIFAK